TVAIVVHVGVGRSADPGARTRAATAELAAEPGADARGPCRAARSARRRVESNVLRDRGACRKQDRDGAGGGANHNKASRHLDLQGKSPPTPRQGAFHENDASSLTDALNARLRTAIHRRLADLAGGDAGDAIRRAAHRVLPALRVTDAVSAL